MLCVMCMYNICWWTLIQWTNLNFQNVMFSCKWYVYQTDPRATKLIEACWGLFVSQLLNAFSVMEHLINRVKPYINTLTWDVCLNQFPRVTLLISDSFKTWRICTSGWDSALSLFLNQQGILSFYTGLAAFYVEFNHSNGCSCPS